MGLRLLLVIMVALAAQPAGACPAGSPCLKYRRMPPPPPPVQIVRYTRSTLATLDRMDRASIVRFLTGSTWTTGLDTIRFVDPRAGHFARPPRGERRVLVREVETTRAGVFIGIDGALFSLTTCRVGRTLSTCLEATSRTDAQLFGGLGYGG